MARSKSVILAMLVILGFCGSAFAEQVIYVDVDATGANNGQSWENAYNKFYDALDVAQDGDKIWVAQGTYGPDTDGLADPREATFAMKNGVIVKGGYAGFGEPDPDARDVELYETILSGDLNGDDGPDFANNGDNSYHVVTGSGTDETAVLDGFTITAGNANGPYQLNQNVGGGMFNYGYPDPNPNSPTLNNCTFRDNFAILSGGGISNRWESSPRLTDCIFIGNSAKQGGGMSSGHLSHSTLINCIFIGNSATGDRFGGGGLFVYNSRQTLINCLFFGNSAPYGGGMDFSDNHEMNLINCVFSGNSANYGGGMHSWYFCEGVNLYNCSFSNNSANYFGGAICCDEEYGITQKMDLINCILWGNNDSSSSGEFSQIYPSVYDLSVSYCDIQGGWPGEENIDADPLFVGPDGPDGIAGTQDDDFRLSANSPCIDAGDNSAVTVTTDLAGNARIVDTVDMGAYEFQGTHLIYVDADAVGTNNGQSWADAYTSLAVVLMDATYPDEIRVAQGTYRPDTDGLADPREATFAMKNGVIVKGGYAGFGEPNPDARNIELYETILSGDLAGNDVDVSDPADLLTEPTRGENSYHVFSHSFENSLNASAVLDGFTITGGNAGLSRGGGMYSDFGSPTLSNCTFIGNSAYNGGGMYNHDSYPILINCLFIGNAADGIYGGGGIYNMYSNLILTNCVFIGNHADDSGGGFVDDWCSHSTLTNCTFIDNSADIEGGGMWCYDCCFGDPILNNCIFWGNSDNSGINESSQIYVNGPSCNPNINYSSIQGWTGALGGTGNIDADPLFVDPNGPDGIAGTQDDDLRLSADSLCIDVGDNSAVTVTTDLDGNQRIINNFVDMGAYEFQGMHGIYVDDDAVGDPGPGDLLMSDPDENGTAAHPFDAIQEAIDCSRNGHTVIVLPGNYSEAFNFIGKSITVTSGEEAPAILEAPGNYVATFHSGEDPNSILKNFVIRNSNIGVFCNHASPTLKYLTVVENASGIESWNASKPQISNSIFWDNLNSDLLQCQAVYSCIERESAGLGNLSADPLFADPANGDYHLKSEGWRWREAVSHGSHWTWDGATSPCIDAGNPGSPLGAEPLSLPEDPNNEWGLNLRVNMGAYGGTAQASMAIPGWSLQADTDNDGRVNMEELIMLRDQWLIWEIREPYCDFNRDGIVNLGDFQVLAKEWLQEALRTQ